MARTYPLYFSLGTAKYSFFQYGSGFEYGINAPPPTPYNLQVENGPTIVDGTPYFSWTNPTFSWEAEWGDGDPIQYEMQFSYGDPSFSSIDKDTNVFSADDYTYVLAPEYELGREGTYYARIRSTDGYTYSDWSESLKFVLFLFSPYPPTIDPVTSPAEDFWQVITGTKAAGLFVYIRNNAGAWTQVDYTNTIAGNAWYYNMPLTSGENYIEVISAVTTDLSNAISDPVSATIYLVVNTPEVFNVWNCFDEFGLLLSLPRIRAERNREYKARLLDVYTNKANSTYQGLIYGIARELGIDYADVSIERLEDLLDPSYGGNLLNSEGNAIGTKLVDYADEVYDHNPIFFGTVICDESYWDCVDEETNGYVYLPHIWDPSASGIYDKWQCAGIGDFNDLWVGDPREVWNTTNNDYSWYLPIHTGYFYSAYPSGVLII